MSQTARIDDLWAQTDTLVFRLAADHLQTLGQGRGSLPVFDLALRQLDQIDAILSAQFPDVLDETAVDGAAIRHRIQQLQDGEAMRPGEVQRQRSALIRDMQTYFQDLERRLGGR